VPINDGSRKTLEGTLAGALSTLAAWWAVLFVALGGHPVAPLPRGAAAASWLGRLQWQQLAAATAGACLLEACTSQLDNILIPLWAFPHCLLVSPTGAW
jgi:dolichol kinase